MRTNVKFLVKLFSKSLQGVGQRPTTLTLVGGSQRETRETAKRFSRTAAQLPSQSRLPPCQHLAAASGAVCQWQTSRTDRRGSGDRLLGNVPLGRNSPFSKGLASAAVCPQAGFIFPASCAHPAGGRGWRCPPYRRRPSRPPASYNRWASSRPRCTRPCTPG